MLREEERIPFWFIHFIFVVINSCDSPNFTGCQSGESKCVGTKDGFVCRCVDGYIDLNPSNPGTNCSKAGIVYTPLDYINN